jgi:hypothetical protein
LYQGGQGWKKGLGLKNYPEKLYCIMTPNLQMDIWHQLTENSPDTSDACNLQKIYIIKEHLELNIATTLQVCYFSIPSFALKSSFFFTLSLTI